MPLRDIWMWIKRRWEKGLPEGVKRWAQRGLFAGVFIYLVIQLTDVGWANIWKQLPTHPLFYIIFLGMYFGLPVAETLIYRLLWRLPFWKSFPVLLKKRVYNKDVLNYSGEAHLYWWAKKHVDRSGRLILRDIKDNTIISSLTSMSIAFTLLGVFLAAGLLPFEALFGQVNTSWIVGGAFCLVLLIALAIRYRDSVISVPAATAASLFGLHAGRLIFVQTLQVLQWAVVMPDVPWTAWFTLLALQIVVNQIPLIPAKDLIVLGASTELSAWLEVSEAGVAGMLLVVFVMDRVLNLILFAYVSWMDRKAGDPPKPLPGLDEVSESVEMK